MILSFSISQSGFSL